MTGAEDKDVFAIGFVLSIVIWAGVAYYFTKDITLVLVVLSPLLLIAAIVVLAYIFTAIVVLGEFSTAVVMKLLE